MSGSGQRIEELECPICKQLKGQFRFLEEDPALLLHLYDFKWFFEYSHYGDGVPNAICGFCGYEAVLDTEDTVGPRSD
jgi:hypothetical protein